MDDHRKSLFNKMDKKRADKTHKERRDYLRKTHFVPVDYTTQDRAYTEFIHDISVNGVFIETQHLLSPGHEIALTFSLPGHSSHIKIAGKVVRTSPTGIGVSFIPLDLTQKKIISACIDEI